MEEILLDILEELRRERDAPGAPAVDGKAVARIIRKRNEGRADNADHFAKKQLFPYYRQVKRDDPARWRSWGIDEALEARLVQLLRVKPRRTASGVATITVLTKPWPCASNCLYCPNDLRMPKSYLADEPACQRAERAFFDPYLQVAARLSTLEQMGHVTDKVELIVLGGTWSDYPEGYRIWFASELFRALNEAGEGDEEQRRTRMEARRARYREAGVPETREEAAAFAADAQRQVNAGALRYNDAMARLYGSGSPWERLAAEQTTGLAELERQHAANEHAAHRVVGLVVETRPDAVTPEALAGLRRLGCTKVQIGVQSLDGRILSLNERCLSSERIAEAFSLLRLFGFKIHAHFMANLLGATTAADKRDYRRLVTDPAFLPDEVKLYPCALVDGTGLMARYRDGSWRPYTEEELLDVLVADAAATPPYTRISRMIRDISSHDIVAGNKKVNLRQLVEQRAREAGVRFEEIRTREIGTDGADVGALALSVVAYETAVASERFLQWTSPDGRIAAFLRLSLPFSASVDDLRKRFANFPIGPGEAMIREVHVYGAVAKLHRTGAGAQHLGLGKRLVEAAADIARKAGYEALNVISAVGTRGYYRSLGFQDKGLYQQKPL
ncbi:histone acetyltransferase [Gordonibacter sp. An230]|nr:histone acetyltransferase [Gordonibacter sp. An230]